VGATVGQRQPLLSCRQLSGEGDGSWRLNRLNSVLNTLFPVVLRKDFVIYTHAYSGTWNIQNDTQGNCSGVVRCAAPLPTQSGIRGKGPCQFVRLLKFKCGSAHRHPIVIRRDPQQFDLGFGAVEGLS
jgi:hypothetical protein